jgi:hypothetical protein
MTTDRIQQLEDQVARLQSEIAILRGDKPTVVPHPIDDRPLLTILQPPAIELPAAEQCRKLIEIVGRSHPLLQRRYSMRWHDEEDRELHAGFFTSVRFIATLGRAAAPDGSVYLSHWIDRCRDWTRLLDCTPSGNIGVSFFLAAVAMGVPYQFGNDAMGVLPAVGLRLHGGERMTSDGWKQALAGNVLAPTLLARRFG